MNAFRLPALLPALFLGLAVSTASAQTTAPVHEALDAASDYHEGCYGPCLCALVLYPDLTGSFDLQFTSADPAGYLHYDVLNVNLLVGGTNPKQIAGTGTYVRGGMAPAHEQMVLDLSINGGNVQHYDSGLVVSSTTFPDLDVTLAVNHMVCYDYVPHIVAHAGATTGAPFCFGDGSGTACPCGNAGAAGNGCASSVDPSGANLAASGTASVSADTAVLHSSGTPNAAALFFQGTTQLAGGAGVVFGDGLRCAGGTIHRLKTTQPLAGQAQVPGASDPALSVLGGITAAGTFEYQVWYRNAAAFCTSSTFNLTNGLEITWSP